MLKVEKQKITKSILYAKQELLKEYYIYTGDKRKNPKYTLLKYFPKYIHKIHMEDYDGRTITKLKRTKIVHDFNSWDARKKRKLLWRILLANKIKSIQAIPLTGIGPKQTLREIRLFPSIKELWIARSSARSFDETEDDCQREINQLCRIAHYLEGMLKLEKISIFISCFKLMSVLRNIDCSRFKHLKKFRIDFEYLDDIYAQYLGDILEENMVFPYV